MTDRVCVGQQRPTRMRRIGERHMIVMPAQTAQVLSVDDVERALQTARVQQQQLQQQVDRQRAFVADLEQQLAAFKALPIVRDDDDPSVPQPEPPAAATSSFDGTLRSVLTAAGGGGRCIERERAHLVSAQRPLPPVLTDS